MHSMQVEMSLQLSIAFVHVPPSKFGQWPMFHPMSQSAGSLPSASCVPHVLSFPAHALTIPALSFVLAFAIVAAVFASAWQSVAGGSLPFRMASRHFCNAVAFARTNPSAAFTIAPRHLLATFTTEAGEIETWYVSELRDTVPLVPPFPASVITSPIELTPGKNV